MNTQFAISSLSSRKAAPLPILLMFLLLTLLAGCSVSPQSLAAGAAGASAAAAPVPEALVDVVEPVSAYVAPRPVGLVPTPTPTPETKLTATINTQNIRANLRSAPGTNSVIVAKANPGEVYEIVGRSDDGLWYEVALSQPISNTETVWISAELVRVGDGVVPVTASTEALLDAELTAQWAVDWSCFAGQDRCPVKACTAVVTAEVNRTLSDNFLPVEHTSVWEEGCPWPPEGWTFEVNTVDGKERTSEADDNFLYSYWLGENPGEANGVFPYKDDQGILVYCAGPQEVEIEYGGGWKQKYEGFTCHDIATGMLVYLSYIERYAYSGDYEGKTFDNAYFGDSTRLVQRLVDTTAPVALVEKQQ
jgi:hypothetical protein